MNDLVQPSVLDTVRESRSQWRVRRQELLSLDLELSDGSRNAIARSRALLKRTGPGRSGADGASAGPARPLARREAPAPPAGALQSEGEWEAEMEVTVQTLLQNIARAEELTRQHECLIHEIEHHCADARQQIRSMKATARKLRGDADREAEPEASPG
jgi:hypothetical protein